jgi:predicted metalloprotease with PDZ domain
MQHINTIMVSLQYDDWSRIMKKSVIAIGLVLLAGLAIATYLANAPPIEPVATSAIDSADYFDQSAAIDDRILALEAAVAEERNARQLLEDEMQVLYTEIEQLSDQRSASDARDEQRLADSSEIRERIEGFRQRRNGGGEASRVARLIESGVAPDRAEWLLQRESELQMEAMQARFDARRSGDPVNPFDPSLNSNSALRAEIGDTEYEQYLQANNRPTAVSIGNVLESSPAQSVGLQQGDQIVNYDGNRVFNVSDLNQQTMLGEPGEAVVVDFTRDGMPMQVVLPRGPIGVSTGRDRGRR